MTRALAMGGSSVALVKRRRLRLSAAEMPAKMLRRLSEKFSAQLIAKTPYYPALADWMLRQEQGEPIRRLGLAIEAHARVRNIDQSAFLRARVGSGFDTGGAGKLAARRAAAVAEHETRIQCYCLPAL